MSSRISLVNYIYQELISFLIGYFNKVNKEHYDTVLTWIIVAYQKIDRGVLLYLSTHTNLTLRVLILSPPDILQCLTEQINLFPLIHVNCYRMKDFRQPINWHKIKGKSLSDSLVKEAFPF